MSREDVKLAALLFGWKLTADVPSESENVRRLAFTRKGVALTVWYDVDTVLTVMTHPKLGKTRLRRKNVTPEEMEDIFKNPRLHTRKGYLVK